MVVLNSWLQKHKFTLQTNGFNKQKSLFKVGFFSREGGGSTLLIVDMSAKKSSFFDALY